MTITGVKIMVNADSPLTGMGSCGAMYLMVNDPRSEAKMTFEMKITLESVELFFIEIILSKICLFDCIFC